MSQAAVHPSAVVEPGARLGTGVRVGAFSYIGTEVEIGDGTVVGPHCSIHGPTRIGRDNRILGHAALGGDPQDKKYGGERVELAIGDRNTIREFVTINRGTGAGGGCTRIGDDNWLLAYTHVAHDCVVGNHCVFSNNATLAAMLAKRPMVVGYRVAGLTYRMVKGLGMLKVDHYALPNVLAGEPLVPELMQHDCTPDRLAEAVLRWLRDPVAVARLVPRFLALHQALRQDASVQAANAVIQLLETGPDAPATQPETDGAAHGRG